MTHWLVIHEQGDDYSIEHEPDCAQEDWIDDPDGIPIRLYTCLVGSLINDAGLTDAGVEWEQLSVGRYEIEGWSQRHPANPYHPEEWSAGINLVGDRD